jgi:hypothetical protein
MSEHHQFQLWAGDRLLQTCIMPEESCYQFGPEETYPGVPDNAEWWHISPDGSTERLGVPGWLRLVPFAPMTGRLGERW